MTDLTNVETHFAFGKNWASYARGVGVREIDEARKGLLRLLPAEAWPGRSFLDIGCGSGVHALAAASLGVSRIQAIDIDADSVSTTRAMLERAELRQPWDARVLSVFDADPATLGTFDIVYSWGVLHHTGAMWRAVENASRLVAPGGHFVVALYRSTYTDALWTAEKKLYAKASPAVQKAIRGVYIAAVRGAFLATGRNYREHERNYRSSRGMDLHHDIHDWLGGYPYETALAPEVEARLGALGFTAERVFARPKSVGVLGSGCDEYVYRRQPSGHRE